jgi:hypothetical protein
MKTQSGTASGRFAVIDDGLGFQLVPWTPSLEKQLGRHVSGVSRDDGGVTGALAATGGWGFDHRHSRPARSDLGCEGSRQV